MTIVRSLHEFPITVKYVAETRLRAFHAKKLIAPPRKTEISTALEEAMVQPFKIVPISPVPNALKTSGMHARKFV